MIINLTESIKKEIARNNINNSLQLALRLQDELQKSGKHEYYHRLITLRSQLYNSYREKLNRGSQSQEDYEISRNKIIWNLIQLLNEIESDPEIKSEIEINIALAQTEEAIQRLLYLTKGTDIYNKILMLSSRFYNFKKDFEKGKKPSVINRLLKSIVKIIGDVYRRFT